MEKIEIKKCETSFMTKSDFLEQKKSERFLVEPSIDQKLEKFKDNDVLAIEFSINSPAIVTDILDGNDIVKFMNDKFLREGLSTSDINNALKIFEEKPTTQID